MTRIDSPLPCLRNRLADRDTGWPWWYMLVGYACFVLAGMLPGLAAPVVLADGPGGQMALSVVNMLVLGILPLGALVLLARRRPGRRQLGLTFRGLGRLALIALMAVAGLNLLLMALAALLPAGWFGGGADTASLRADGLGMGLPGDLAFLLSVTVLAPVAEELAFRAAVFRPLHDGLRGWHPTLRVVVAVMLGALVFTLPHSTPGEASFLPYLLVAMLFPVIYLVTGSLVAAILAHSFQSTYAWGMLLYGARDTVSFSPLLYVFVALSPVMVLALTWLAARVFTRV